MAGTSGRPMLNEEQRGYTNREAFDWLTRTLIGKCSLTTSLASREIAFFSPGKPVTAVSSGEGKVETTCV